MTALAIVVLLSGMSSALWWVGRRTWQQMGGHSPTPYDRSQRQNRLRSAEWYTNRGHVRSVRYARRTTVSRDQ